MHFIDQVGEKKPLFYRNNVALLGLAVLAQILLNGVLLIFMYCTNSDFSWDLIKYRYSLWDGHHYLRLAQHGYQSFGDNALFIVFLPLYPALIKLVASLTHSYFVAGWLVSNVMSAIGHVFLYKTLKIWGFTRQMRIAAIVFILLSPPALYFCVIYTEGLFYCLLCIVFFFLARQEFLLAALFGLLLSLSRQTGLVLVLSYFLVLVMAWQHLPRTAWFKNLIYTGFIPTGYLFYLMLNKSVYGDFFYYTQVLKGNWHKEMVNPFVQYWNNIISFKWHYPSFTDQYMYFQDYLWMVIFPIFLLMPLFLKLKIPKYFLIWGAGSFLIFLSQSFWLSSARYVWMTLVFQLVLASLARGNLPFTILVMINLIGISFPAWYFFAIGGWVF